jgi:hypothetical protein
VAFPPPELGFSIPSRRIYKTNTYPLHPTTPITLDSLPNAEMNVQKLMLRMRALKDSDIFNVYDLPL